MIRNDSEYKQAIARLEQERARMDEQRRQLRQSGLTAKQIKRILDPMESFHLQLKEEVASYDRLRRGQFDELHNFHGIGQLLIGLRIAQGMSQRELAEQLEVHESQVSRDERNEYFNITVERASRILDALGVDLRSTVLQNGRQSAA
ncbi:MAG: helix-turn-helix domain-containing protein [Rhodospirillales bacterium]|nr:helix-turn-helix domain-containing protein [Rhodospirillales bacterium]